MLRLSEYVIVPKMIMCRIKARLKKNQNRAGAVISADSPIQELHQNVNLVANTEISTG